MYGPQLLSTITGVQSIARFLPEAVTRKILPVATAIAAICLPVYYICIDAPHAYQRNVMKKIKKELEKEDYENNNSLRIAKEVRKVLNYPSNDVSIEMNGVIEAHSSHRAKLISELKKGESGMKFYKELKAKVECHKRPRGESRFTDENCLEIWYSTAKNAVDSFSIVKNQPRI